MITPAGRCRHKRTIDAQPLLNAGDPLVRAGVTAEVQPGRGHGQAGCPPGHRRREAGGSLETRAPISGHLWDGTREELLFVQLDKNHFSLNLASPPSPTDPLLNSVIILIKSINTAALLFQCGEKREL